jgi:hypothetical protein
MPIHSLLLVGQLCNEVYSVKFKIDAVTIKNPRDVQILKGARDLDMVLWCINLRNTGALVNYVHKDMFSPAKSALLQVAKHGHLITWPCLTEQAINKHLILIPVTAMGNMNQCRQNIRSTSKNSITSDM